MTFCCNYFYEGKNKLPVGFISGVIFAIVNVKHSPFLMSNREIMEVNSNS